jgi:hypothetical protein
VSGVSVEVSRPSNSRFFIHDVFHFAFLLGFLEDLCFVSDVLKLCADVS